MPQTDYILTKEYESNGTYERVIACSEEVIKNLVKKLNMNSSPGYCYYFESLADWTEKRRINSIKEVLNTFK